MKIIFTLIIILISTFFIFLNSNNNTEAFLNVPPNNFQSQHLSNAIANQTNLSNLQTMVNQNEININSLTSQISSLNNSVQTLNKKVANLENSTGPITGGFEKLKQEAINMRK